MPGPKEQDLDQVQRFMHIIVNKLIRLWQDGLWIKTAQYPLGCLIHVILLCVCCNKLAVHKLGGFGSHSHTFFCTQCWIQQQQKATKEAFQRNGKLCYSTLSCYCLSISQDSRLVVTTSNSNMPSNMLADHCRPVVMLL
jgi:hypothetical protein